jgi:hypothetical protein
MKHTFIFLELTRVLELVQNLQEHCRWDTIGQTSIVRSVFLCGSFERIGFLTNYCLSDKQAYSDWSLRFAKWRGNASLKSVSILTYPFWCNQGRRDSSRSFSQNLVHRKVVWINSVAKFSPYSRQPKMHTSMYV